MYESSIVADDTIGSNQHVVGDWVSKHFNTKRIGDDFFGLLVKVGVDEGDVVVAGDTVS